MSSDELLESKHQKCPQPFAPKPLPAPRAVGTTPDLKRPEAAPGKLEAALLSDRPRRLSLLNLCVSNLGCYLDEVVDDIHLVVSVFPPLVKSKLVAIARRKALLNDQLLSTLADESWDILDVSGSDVSDAGMLVVANICRSLKAIDVSRCTKITSKSIQALLNQCPELQTLRCGGTLLSDKAAKLSLPHILPRLVVEKEAEDNWEDLEEQALGRGAQALRWIVWPAIDEDSKELVKSQCPRIVVNPSRAKALARQGQVPREALPGIILDEVLVEDLAASAFMLKPKVAAGSAADAEEMHIAEKFRLAYLARDERLAPKRAKNWRQSQRRAAKAWLSSDLDARSRYLASLHGT